MPLGIAPWPVARFSPEKRHHFSSAREAPQRGTERVGRYAPSGPLSLAPGAVSDGVARQRDGGAALPPGHTWLTLFRAIMPVVAGGSREFVL